MLRSLTIIGYLACSACSVVHPDYELTPANVANKSIIIFVPGYYGTALANAQTGERLHLTVGKAIFDGPPLTMHSESLDLPGFKMKIEGVLDRLTFFPWVYSLDINGGAIDALDETFPNRVVAFAYDWRDSNVKSAQLLGNLVDKIRAAGAEKIAIVAHSNGGVVTSYYLRYGLQDLSSSQETWAGAQAIDGVVLLGTPFRGVMSGFHNMHNGVTFGLAKTPLNSVAMSSFPSLYELLPADSSKDYLKNDGTPLQENPYEFDWWTRHGWGLFKAKEGMNEKNNVERRFKYFQEKLTSGILFSKKILEDLKVPPKKKIPALVILGRGEETLAKAKWSSPRLGEKGLWDFEAKILFEDGDRTIPYRSALLPEPYQQALDAKTMDAEVLHAKMGSNTKILARIKSFLVERGF